MAKWWKSFLSLPNEQSPLIDDTGANLDNGQVWSCVLFSRYRRHRSRGAHNHCAQQQTDFFPLFYAVNINAPKLTGKDETAEELRDQIDNGIEAVDTLFFSANTDVDGSNPNPLDYRQKSPPFSVTLPDNNIFGVDAAGTYKPAVSDGYWLMLAPLAKGNYELRFGGADTAPNGFSQDISYGIMPVAEPFSVLGTLAMGAFGAGWMVKRKLKQKV